MTGEFKTEKQPAVTIGVEFTSKIYELETADMSEASSVRSGELKKTKRIQL